MSERTPRINDPRPNRFPRKKGFSGNRPNKPIKENGLNEIDKNKFLNLKKISEENSNDMTDYPIGEGKEYPGNPDMPRIRGTVPPGFGEPQEIKDGGLIELNKGKDYIKDLI